MAVPVITQNLIKRVFSVLVKDKEFGDAKYML